jgi:hypothetical protein
MMRQYWAKAFGILKVIAGFVIIRGLRSRGAGGDPVRLRSGQVRSHTGSTLAHSKKPRLRGAFHFSE